MLEWEEIAQIKGRIRGAKNTKYQYPDFILRWENTEKNQVQNVAMISMC